MTITEKLHQIQIGLKAPKGEYNQFGKYKYRSCEDILEALKPKLKEHGAAVTVTDEVVNIAQRIYIKATATLHHSGESVSVSGFAREPEMRKGMDESQITGATSSYARKYALCGLFAIDDNRDPDATNTHDTTFDVAQTVKELNEADTFDALKKVFGTAWRAADKAQQAAIRPVYEARKAHFEKG